tara:strand:+ start:1964 stop:2461 length:498 start_codon:yes stop_codon:yes gene_type:complete
MTWIVVKYKKNKLSKFKNDLTKKIGNNIKFYFPKIKYEFLKKNKRISKELNLLDDYIFVSHEKFYEIKNLKLIEYCRGLKSILRNFSTSQKNISDFINKCKKHEKDGSISNLFMEDIKNSEFVFLTGPFYKKIFKIIDRKKNYLEISINNFNLRIRNNNLIFKNT